MEERVRALLDEWQAAVRTQDIDRYMRLHWGDTVKLIGQPNGVVEILEGAEEIREEIQTVFAEHGEFLSGHEYPPAEYSFDGPTGMAQLKFGLENPSLLEALRFKERDGELKIAEHWVFFRFFPEVEASESTGWADDQGNGNGRLESDEQERLFLATHRVMFEPGPVDTPLDDFFDWNENGRLDEYEAELAATELVRNRLRRIDLWNAEFAAQRVPPAGQEYVSIHDANWLSAAVLDAEIVIPVGPVGMLDDEAELAELIDMNRDRMISQIEVDIYRDLIMRVAAVNPAPITYNGWMPAFTDDIRRWANADFEGELTDDEYGDAGYVLFGIAGFPDQTMTWTPIHRFFDRNRDGFLVELEQEWARDFMFGFLFPAAVEMGVEVYDWEQDAMVEFEFDFDGDSRVSADEQESVRGFITDFDRQFWQENDPDGTPHRWVDYNDDGQIEMWEGDIFRDKLFQALLKTWLQLPFEEANSLTVRSALDQAADMNGDGMLSVEERELMIDGLMQPHGVGSEFDRQIDFDGNGELTMDEIYRAQDTGVIPVGEESAERRVASLDFGGGTATGSAGQVELQEDGDSAEKTGDAGPRAAQVVRRSRASSPARVKAVSSWGSSLAVLGVRDMTEKMDQGQTNLLVSFLENAFVNYGNVTVVDRQNLEKIMEEYKYQTSALVDEETAVEIGKLSGADAIAIGNLSKLGDTFYLHLKIINVESGAIIGSSISQGLSENDFLGMCDGAVDPLF
ncbi:MAG: CsgG/HfaB family protein [bacterium]